MIRYVNVGGARAHEKALSVDGRLAARNRQGGGRFNAGNRRSIGRTGRAFCCLFPTPTSPAVGNSPFTCSQPIPHVLCTNVLSLPLWGIIGRCRRGVTAPRPYTWARGDLSARCHRGPSSPLVLVLQRGAGGASS